MEFYGYRDFVDAPKLQICVRAAGSDIDRRTSAGGGSTPMGTEPYVWSSGDTALYLVPDKHFTWRRFWWVPGARRRFMGLSDYKGAQFILLWRNIGPVGYGHFVRTSVARSLDSTPTLNEFEI